MNDILNAISSLAVAQQPWWVYALALFVPFSILLAFREVCCWFWKLNKILRRIERLENKVITLQNSIKKVAVEESLSQESRPLRQNEIDFEIPDAEQGGTLPAKPHRDVAAKKI